MCDKRLRCDHQGRKDIIAHSERKSHQALAKQLQSQSKLSFSSPSASEASQRTEAELKMAVLTAHCNIPFAFHDKLSPAIRELFPDSKIASKYHSASTKATSMLNGAVAPVFISELVSSMKVHPFSICIDGSNDSGLEKINPITVRIYDVNINKVVTRFLDMCTSTSSTAEALYTALNGRLSELLSCENPWLNCISVGVDNTSVNIGIRNSIKSRVLQRNSNIYFNGCPCHIIHNTAHKAGEEFTSYCNFDLEEFVIDLFYWFDKSTRRKNELACFCSFCDQAYRSIVKHVSTRWLSLESAVERSLKQYQSLKSYFLSSHESQARFIRLQHAFEDPLTEVYLLFHQSLLPTFTHVNMFLQKEEPLIHALQPQLISLLKKILGKFLKPSVIAESIDSLTSIDYKNIANQVIDAELVIGYVTKQKIRKLYDDGDISESSYKLFFKAARAFLVKATEYLLKWCPLQDELLHHATWIDFTNRLNKHFSSVEYFVHKYPTMFEDDLNMDCLNEQFLTYQLLKKEDIPRHLLVDPDPNLAEADTHYHVDALWGYLRGVRKPGCNELEFNLLFKVAEVVLTIPHSNAGEERIFSFINKNKTPSRSSLDIKGTLSSLTVVKTHIENPLVWKPTEELLQKAKKATKTYNEQHTK